MRILMIGLIFILVGSLIFVLPGNPADQRLPGANEFVYGAWLDLAGQQMMASVSAAAGLGLDWIAFDFDWAAWAPDPNQLPDLNALSLLLDAARQSNLRVMLSLSNPPTWAATPDGPDPHLTASLVVSLARLYGSTLGAIELYPAANTLHGWGAPPDPGAYAGLLQTVDAALNVGHLPITLVASLAPAQEQGDVNDGAFLDGLYRAGAAGRLPVVGLRLPALSGEPKADPAGGAGQVLRHYETLRQVMLNYGQSRARIWITGFSWPASSAFASPERQAQWLSRAYKLLRAQLYIGAAFFQQLNPPASGVDSAAGRPASLILPGGSLHPACAGLAQLTSLDGNVQTVTFQGPVTKKSPTKKDLKP